MRYFTDSPYERLMQEIPSSGDNIPAALPENHPCYGCGHHGGCCFALCHRKENTTLLKPKIKEEER